MRAYTYNAASDRTGLTTYAPADDGGCQRATVDATRTWTYDTADRITNAGYQYDALGNATVIPADDTQTWEASNLTMGYCVNGQTRSITQNDVSNTFALDVGHDRVRSRRPR